jgi:hypothetical protein
MDTNQDLDVPLQAESVQDTLKQHFLPLAKMLEMGYPLPVQTDYVNIIKSSIPTGESTLNYFTQQSLKNLPSIMEKSAHGKWKNAMVSSRDEMWFITYRSNVFPSDIEACGHAMVMFRNGALKSLQYTDNELER